MSGTSAGSRTTTSPLFEPLEIAGVPMRNRVMMAPMGSCQSDEDGFVTDQTIAYYERRAGGGVGAITVEAALIDPESHGHEPGIHGPQFIPGLRRVANAIKAHGVAVGIQFMHPGRQVTSGPCVAPSPVPLNSASPVPHELTVPEIERIVRLYGEAAARAEEAGYQYVEVHGAHGYLPSDFLSPIANLRDDEYGGDFQRRLQFVLETAAAIREAAEIPLFWRLSADELRAGGFTVDDQLRVAGHLQDAGVAAISVSAGTWNSLEVTVAPMSVPRGHLLSYASRFKEHLQIPVLAVGRLDDPALAERVIVDGVADVVLLGRGLLADPDWAHKVGAGHAVDVRPCIACNACVELIARGFDLRCAVNPETGRESTWVLEAATAARQVMVVGGGPAGMTAARLARERGHHVSIWERDDRLGGKIDVASRAPSKSEVLKFLDHDARELEQLGVEIHLGAEVDARTVCARNPDVVVLATGADPLLPPIPGIEDDSVLDAQELLYDRRELAPGASVAIVGGSATGCETAELLLEAGVEVTLLEMAGSIGAGIESITRRQIVRGLRAMGATILTGAIVTAVEPGRVIYQRGEERGWVRADIVAMAVGWRPRGAVLAEALAGREVVVVGDAHRPADFVAATSAGGLAALEL